MFTKEESYYNVYGEYAGRKMTCMVCGKTWINNTRNDGWGHNNYCENIFTWKEWDGSTTLVHVDKEELRVRITYQGGVTNTVHPRYAIAHLQSLPNWLFNWAQRNKS